MPTLYYGDEAGLTGWTDPDNRRTYPWGKENKELIEFYKAAIQIRKENDSLKYGSLKQLYSAYGVVGYGRFIEGNRCMMLFNNSQSTEGIFIPVWQMGVEDGKYMERLIFTKEDTFTLEKKEILVENGHIKIDLETKSAMILREVIE